MPIALMHRGPRYKNLARLVLAGLWVVIPLCSRGAEIRVEPQQLALKGSFARAQMLVTRVESAALPPERAADLTRQASFASSNDSVVTVGPSGKVLALGNGQAEIAVTVNGQTLKVPVTVSDVPSVPKIDYDGYVRPIVSKAGCNMGACHASQHGKGGFKLSVFAFQPAEDHLAITRDRSQRRVNFLDPEASLILRKPTMQVAHGGGRRLSIGSTDYRILVEWIKAGAPAPNPQAPTVTKLSVFPDHRLGRNGLTQQLRVEAAYSDGVTRDVTAWAKFQSMDDAVVAVNDTGVCSLNGKGQATVMVRFEGQAVVSEFIVPYADTVALAGWRNNNFVDEAASAKFRELGIEPSGLCSDSAFIRRAFLDATGSTPTVEETVAFLNSTAPDKREKLVDRLLGLTGDPALDVYNERYAAYWTLKWSDIIRNQSAQLGEQGMWALYNWLNESFRTNKPFPQFVRELITAQGSTYRNGPANYFRINATAEDLTESTAQLFLGIRLQCAKCHHHPFEKYSRADYQNFAGFFTRVGTKGSQDFGLFGGETVVLVRMTGDAKARPLDGQPVTHPLDLRIPLADWLTNHDYLAKSVVNRYTSYLLGRGLVNPVDDLRETNPPSNAQLMDALANDFRKSGYNVKHLMRTIMASRLYQLSSQPTKDNEADLRFYSHYKVKRIAAEPLLDAITSVTLVPTKFTNLPLGTRATQLPDAVYDDYFLKTFGKPKRASVCECERNPDENLAQALHTLNGDTLTTKITNPQGRLAKLLAANKQHDEIVRELYLAALCRYPTADEVAASGEFLRKSPNPRECYEDLLWALLNSKQFLFIE